MRVAITGASGRMGLTLIKAITQTPTLSLTVAIDRADSPLLNKDPGDLAGVGPTGITISDNLAAVTDRFDVLIDFTRPEATMTYLEICRQAGKKMVGATGIEPVTPPV